MFCPTQHSIRGRAVKALRSGRSQLCWRGFESHRMQFFVRCEKQCGSQILEFGLDHHVLL